MKKDISNQQLHSIVAPCGKCKLCSQINTAKLVTNDKLNITEKNKRRWKLQGKGNNLRCTMFQAGEQLSERFSKDRCDIKNRLDNSELEKHFHKNNNLNDDLNVTILQNNIKTAAARRYHEDKWICKLKTLAPNGLNTENGDYPKEMYNFY